MMIRIFHIFKYTTTALVIFLVILYVSGYILLSIPYIQQKVKDVSVRELKQILNTDVQIDRISIQPFNKIALHDLYLQDQQGDTLLYTNKLAAGFDLLPLLQSRLVFTNIQFFGFDINLHKADPAAPLNLQFIVDAFRSDSNRKRNIIDLKIKSILIRRGKISYNVLSEPRKTTGAFDPNHIEVRNLLSTLSLKALAPDTLNLQVKRLSGEEQSGLTLQRLAFKIVGNKKQLTLSNVDLRLPKTTINIDSASVNYARVDSMKQFTDSAALYLNVVNSEIRPSDLGTLLPALKKIELPVQVDLRIQGAPDQLSLKYLRLKYSNSISLNAEGTVSGLSTPGETFLFGKIQELYLSTKGMQSLIQQFNPAVRIPLVDNLENIRFTGEISGFFDNLVTYGFLRTPYGTLHADILAGNHPEENRITYKGKLTTSNFNLGGLTGQKKRLDKITFNLNIDGQQTHKHIRSGKVNGNIDKFDLNGYPYENIRLDGQYDRTRYNGNVQIDDPNGKLTLTGLVDFLGADPVFKFNAQGEKIRLNDLKLTRHYPGSELTFDIAADFTGRAIDKADGTLALRNGSFRYNDNQFTLDSLFINAAKSETQQSLTVRSDLLNGSVSGTYSLKSLPQSVFEMLHHALPSLFKENAKKDTTQNNDFQFQFTLKPSQELSKTFELPVSLSQESRLEGFFSDKQQKFKVEATVPDARMKNSRLENTHLLAEKQDDNVRIRAAVDMINKQNKYILLTLNAQAAGDSTTMQLNWSNLGNATFSGTILANTHYQRSDKNIVTRTDIIPSAIIMNDTIWNMQPARITTDSAGVNIRNFEIRHQSQFLKIDGTSSKNPDDYIHLKLNDVNLGYIFETVNIRHVTFGGRATGDFSLSNLTVAPRLATDNFKVINFSYNDALLGNLALHSSWNNEEKGIAMQGAISQSGHPDTKINGFIYPTKEKNAIALEFDTHHLSVAFLRPFVSKILQDLSGYVNGKIDFFGKFSALNVAGDAYLQDVSFAIDYLNTRYTISDSLHLRENQIYFDRIRLADPRNQIASVSGRLQHNHFKNLRYDIDINHADNFTVFNITEQQNPLYHGTVYGSGAGTIKGDASQTNIDVNLQTNRGSLFTYVLSDNRTASDYPFITYTNRRTLLNNAANDTTRTKHAPQPVLAAETRHNLTVNLQLDVTPDGTMELVIDPATGDRIKANGNGNLRLEYNTFDNLKLYGTYTLEKGNYNFSLQDLITRDFSIRQGSSVSFKGAPLSADLDINAVYSVTANLQDLDETFADDKELTRTNVPVQTILNISGDLQRPDLKFDIGLPSLSQDIERRVRTIINTDDMMNRQVIYLLALGRFYTPDYMNMGQNKNNELASVASSTLSSQLNNLLGQISDKWNIGTQIRSDKGDFSDVEFELALSSQLLNNRLIFNGNFGYRDNPTSNNTFIGDFDLEYLLNRNGNLRFKAYNHYNDRNYYIKSALTTQGAGLVFKRDFTTIQDLFRITTGARKKKRSVAGNPTTLPADTIQPRVNIAESDTIK